MLTIRLIHAFVYKECIVYKSASHFVTKVPECLIKAVIISKSRTLVNGALLDGKNAVDVNGSIRKCVLDLFHFHTVGVNKSRGITIVNFQVICSKGQEKYAWIQTDGGIDLVICIVNTKSQLGNYNTGVKKTIFCNGFCNRVPYNNSSLKCLFNLYICENIAKNTLL